MSRSASTTSSAGASLWSHEQHVPQSLHRVGTAVAALAFEQTQQGHQVDLADELLAAFEMERVAQRAHAA